MEILSSVNWLSLFLGGIVIPAGLNLFRFLRNWWRETRPGYRLLDEISIQSETCKIFVRDLILEKDSRLLAIEPRVGVGVIPNITNLYAEVEGKGIANIFNVLGQMGKTQNIQIVGFREDIRGEWNSQIILLGAQAQKHFDYYRLMRNVAYRMDSENIYNAQTDQVVQRERGYGYGIILKAENPFKIGKRKGIAFLIGGFGVLGTSAATYYFKENFRQLGKDFGSDHFGVVVRAPSTAGEEAVERLKQFDVRFRSRRKLPWDKTPSRNDNASAINSVNQEDIKVVPLNPTDIELGDTTIGQEHLKARGSENWNANDAKNSSTAGSAIHSTASDDLLI